MASDHSICLRKLIKLLKRRPRTKLRIRHCHLAVPLAFQTHYCWSPNGLILIGSTFKRNLGLVNGRLVYLKQIVNICVKRRFVIITGYKMVRRQEVRFSTAANLAWSTSLQNRFACESLIYAEPSRIKVGIKFFIDGVLILHHL